MGFDFYRRSWFLPIDVNEMNNLKELKIKHLCLMQRYGSYKDDSIYIVCSLII